MKTKTILIAVLLSASLFSVTAFGRPITNLDGTVSGVPTNSNKVVSQLPADYVERQTELANLKARLAVASETLRSLIFADAKAETLQPGILAKAPTIIAALTAGKARVNIDTSDTSGSAAFAAETISTITAKLATPGPAEKMRTNLALLEAGIAAAK